MFKIFIYIIRSIIPKCLKIFYIKCLLSEEDRGLEQGADACLYQIMYLKGILKASLPFYLLCEHPVDTQAFGLGPNSFVLVVT